jgi:hypothetical protein
MSVTPIRPVSFVNATSVSTADARAHGYPQEDAEQAKPPAGSDVSSSNGAVATQGFLAFPPDVQPIASLSPTHDMPPALPGDLGPDFSGSVAQWSGAIVDLYA